MNKNLSLFLVPLTLLLVTGNAAAQNVLPANAPLRDALTLDATASTEVIPDLAVITLAAEAQGVDAAPITREVQQIINAALAQAKATAGVEARTGAFATNQRWNKQGVRDGWTVRAELILKGKDFAVLGTLAGKLAQQKLMIVGSGFELSRELREHEEQSLIERGIAAFRSKAQTASRAFGFSKFSLREVNLGSISGDTSPMQPKVFSMRAASAPAADAESMAIEGGKVTLTLTVSGSILMAQ
ncbi:MAG: SIMPL domain-containing protein [Casimicrobium sp.]